MGSSNSFSMVNPFRGVVRKSFRAWSGCLGWDSPRRGGDDVELGLKGLWRRWNDCSARNIVQRIESQDLLFILGVEVRCHTCIQWVFGYCGKDLTDESGGSILLNARPFDKAGRSHLRNHPRGSGLYAAVPLGLRIMKKNQTASVKQRRIGYL